MGLERFVEERKPSWNRLAEIVERVYRRGVRAVRPGELLELLHLYRDASADLARLRTLDAEPGRIRELNRLVTRAHAQIYRGGTRRGGSLMGFFARDYPRLFRQTWRFSFASFLLSGVVALMAFASVQSHPDVVSDILGGAEAEFRGEKSRADIEERFRQLAAPELSSLVTTNNIIVALNAFALGVTFGVGTVYVLIVNGVMLGGFAGAYARSGIQGEFWATVLPHGALELSAIGIAGGAGLLMGHALWCPGDRTRRRALREEAGRAVRLVLGLIPAFVVAGTIEGFITPSAELPRELKLALGISAAVLFWTYLLVAGRRREPPEPSAAGE